MSLQDDRGGGDVLITLATELGVLQAWLDLEGNLHLTSRDTALAIARAMGVLRDAEEAAEALAGLRAARATRPIPLAHVVTAWQPALLALAAGPEATAEWRLTFETGASAEGRARGAVELPALPAGYHLLEVGEAECLVIAAPAEAPSLLALTGTRRAWGVTGSLWGLWQQTGGTELGSFDDLGRAAEALAGHGAAFFGINPVHAIGAASGMISPYSPSHRGFLDTRHISPGVGRPRAADHGDALVDHTAHRRGQDGQLRARFDLDLPEGTENAGLAAWRQEQGQALEAFALFEALSLEHGSDWRRWPPGFEGPDAPGARAFAEARPREIAYHAWLQWIAERDLASAQVRARAAGMKLGLYTDLAVGARPDGAEVWAGRAAFARGVSLGAPPDQFAPGGQDWGLAPLSPPGLARTRYQSVVAMLRAAMRHAGMIRVDHVIGLERAFWVPEDGSPGGYVRSDTTVLLAILRLEAARSETLVVGEDLGVVPEGLRARLAASGLLGCAVAIYERADGQFRHPRDYHSETLGSLGTHDTPTLAGWWEERDIDWRERLGHSGPEDAAAMRAERAADRSTLMHLLNGDWLLPEGLDPDDPPRLLDPALTVAIHALLARAGSGVVAVQLDDALGARDQANIPGTTDEHPNWSRRHRLAAEELRAHPVLARIAAAMGAEGR